jgi:membrane associated rhomboid family serine protease
LTPITTVLIALNAGAFVWLSYTGGLNSNASLVAHGALFPLYVRVYGQWWRIVSGAFLHGGIMHIAMNMIALAQLGTLMENIVGSLPMLWIYSVSLLGSGICVVAFSGNQITVGASGAIYGLFGGLLAVGFRLGPQGRPLVASTLPILVVNLVLTYAIPNISISGHIGGLICGFIATLSLHIDRRSFTARLSG